MVATIRDAFAWLLVCVVLLLTLAYTCVGAEKRKSSPPPTLLWVFTGNRGYTAAEWHARKKFNRRQVALEAGGNK